MIHSNLIEVIGVPASKLDVSAPQATRAKLDRTQQHMHGSNGCPACRHNRIQEIYYIAIFLEFARELAVVFRRRE